MTGILNVPLSVNLPDFEVRRARVILTDLPLPMRDGYSSWLPRLLQRSVRVRVR